MSTKHSPISKLRREASRIAANLKALERGDIVGNDQGKIAAARMRESIKVGVVMDDKIISIDIPWTVIRETSEAGMSEYIVKLMREQRDTAH